jgi:hypothetical protein
MAELGALAIAWRVGVTVFVIVMPTLMFFQLLRFLEWLRDDELIARMAERHDFETDSAGDHLATLTESSPRRSVGSRLSSPRSDDDLRRCVACGTHNVPEATYCSGCLEELD